MIWNVADGTSAAQGSFGWTYTDVPGSWPNGATVINMRATDEAGNFVLIGGDWNQSPAEFKPNFRYTFDTVNVSYLPKDFLSGWQQEYTFDCPTNRRITAPYNPDTTPTTVIDFYIASPNIKVLNLRAINLEFRNSDHNPVLLTFTLK